MKWYQTPDIVCITVQFYGQFTGGVDLDTTAIKAHFAPTTEGALPALRPSLLSSRSAAPTHAAAGTGSSDAAEMSREYVIDGPLAHEIDLAESRWSMSSGGTLAVVLHKKQHKFLILTAFST